LSSDRISQENVSKILKEEERWGCFQLSDTIKEKSISLKYTADQK